MKIPLKPVSEKGEILLAIWRSGKRHKIAPLFFEKRHTHAIGVLHFDPESG
ncbi:MAG: hypothetical protein Q8O37_15755 [Sulfuricellaceae bacterium]|nr:hypothetical protein [Sulfuricellaceae bacterium]